jgi:hypothetical protein
MSKQSFTKRIHSRRQLLAQLGAVGAAVLSGCSELSQTETSSSDSGGASGERPDVESAPTQSGENPGVDIREYGATPDDGTDDTQAFRDAANQAGPGGTVFVPEGTFRIGAGVAEPLRVDGSIMPAGISFQGVSWDQSVVKWVDSSEYDSDSLGSPRGLFYSPNLDHGEVTVKDMTWHGNWRNLGLNPDGKGSTAFGFVFQGSSGTSFTAERVRWTDWWTNGGLALHPNCVFRRCDFMNCGLGPDAIAGSSGHGFNAANKSGEVLAEDCLFKNISGLAIDHRETGGDVRMRRCYASGLGTGLMKKKNYSGTAYLENVYAEVRNEFVTSQLQSWEGRHGVYSNPTSGDSAGRLYVDNVHIANTTRGAIDIDNKFDLFGPGPLILKNANINNYRDGAFHVDETASISLTVDEMGIHDTAHGAAFDIRGECTGQIGDLRRSGNTNGLGNIDGLDIQNDNRGAETYEVNVPAPEDVGAASAE